MRKVALLSLVVVAGCGGSGSSVVDPPKNEYKGTYSGGWYSALTGESGETEFKFSDSTFTATFTNTTLGKSATITGKYWFDLGPCDISGTLVYAGSTLKQPFTGRMYKDLQVYTLNASLDDGNNGKKFIVPLKCVLTKEPK